MRRNEKEITDKKVIESIISRAMVCRLALSENNHPYIIPLCFGYTENTIYFHSAREGKKIDILKKNNQVCFEFDIDHEVEKSDNPCMWGMKYRSVIGTGSASFINDPDMKQKALEIIVRHYSGNSFTFSPDFMKHTAIIKIEIESLSGKESGWPV